MIGIECNNIEEVKTTISYLINKGRNTSISIENLISEIEISANEIGYSVIITDEEKIGYYFVECGEIVEEITFEEYFK